MYDDDPNESVDCSPVQRKQRHQKTLNHRSLRKFHSEINASKCIIDPNTPYSTVKRNSTFLEVKDSAEHCDDVFNYNMLSEVYLLSKADRLPPLQTSEKKDCDNLEIFLSASEFRDNILFSKCVQANSDISDSQLSTLCPKVENLEVSNKFISSVKANNNYSSHLNKSLIQLPKNELYIDIYNDFTEIESTNCLLSNEANLSPPPFRYRRKNLRTYNGPSFDENLTKNSKQLVEINIDSNTNKSSEVQSQKLTCSHSQQLNSHNADQSQNISKNILDLSFKCLSPSSYSIDGLNFEVQHSLESEQNTDFEIKDDKYASIALISKQLSESDDDSSESGISNLEDKILVDVSSSKDELNQVTEIKTPLSLLQSPTKVQQCDFKHTKIKKSMNCNIEAAISKTIHKTDCLRASNYAVESRRPTRKSQRLSNSKSKNYKNDATRNNTQDSQYLTPIGEFLNESNERQLRIREKMTRISFIFNEDENSDDEDFRGFDLSEISAIEDEELHQGYKKSTQNLFNKYLEEDLDVFDAIDESHYSMHNTIKQGETQSLLNDSFMDCPNVLRDVDLLLNRNKSNQATKKCNNFIDSELWEDEDMFKDIKTQNFVKTGESENIVAQTMKENLNQNEDMNFKTPNRSPAKNKFNDSQTLKNKKINSKQLINIPKLEGFKTGSGKPITISNEALKKATNFVTETLNEIDVKEVLDRKPFGKSLNFQQLEKSLTFEKENDFQLEKKVSEAASIPDFEFDGGKRFHISSYENNWGGSFLKDLSGKDTSKLIEVPKLEGFKSGNGKPIKISNEAYKKAAALMANTFDEIEESASLEKNFDEKLFGKLSNNQVPNKYSSFGEANDFQIKKKVKPLSFSGFTGKKVLISDEAMKKAKSIFAEVSSEEPAATFHKLGEINVPSVKEIKNSEQGNDINLNFYGNRTIKEINCNDKTSKRKSEETYELPRKVVKCESENSLRNQQLENCITIHNRANYKFALSIGKPSTSKLHTNQVITSSTPKTAVKKNFSNTPSTPINNENLNKISTPNLADFYNSIITNNKSTPQPGLSPLASNNPYFDDVRPLNNTTNSDLENNSKNNSIITPKRSRPSPKMRIEYLKKIHPKPPDLSPACFINNCKPSGLRKRRSRLSFSKGQSNNSR